MSFVVEAIDDSLEPVLPAFPTSFFVVAGFAPFRVLSEPVGIGASIATDSSVFSNSAEFGFEFPDFFSACEGEYSESELILRRR